MQARSDGNAGSMSVGALRAARILAFALAAAAWAAPALAQDKLPDKFPTRPIRMLVPFAPGGGVDVVARIVGKRLGETLGQPILVESRPGGGGAVAVAELMRAAPDGYTLLMTTSAHATLPKLAKLSWHPSRDFSAVASIYSYVFVIATNAQSRSCFATFGQFLDYVRANPGKINWGSSGIGGPQHLGGSQFVKLAGLDMVHVPYRGNAPMIQALLGDQVQIVFDTPTLVLPRVADGELIALAVTGERRLAALPDVPTVRETGLVDFTYRGQIFVLAPKGMAAALQARLNAEIAAALADKGVRDQLTGFGLDVPNAADNTVAALTRHIDDFKATYDRLIDELGIEAQ